MRPLRVACALALLALLVLLPAGPAAAHATLVSSDPAEGEVLEETPDVVTFTFDEPVSLTAGSVQVFDAAGEAVESDASSRDTVVTTDLPDQLSDGSYVVVWRVVSADGHPIAGSLTFAIGEPSAVVAAPQLPDADPDDVRRVLSVLQGLAYLGLFLAAGVVVCRTWVLRGLRLSDVVVDRLSRVAWSGYGVLVVAGGFAIPVSGAYQQGLGLGGDRRGGRRRARAGGRRPGGARPAGGGPAGGDDGAPRRRRDRWCGCRGGRRCGGRPHPRLRAGAAAGGHRRAAPRRRRHVAGAASWAWCSPCAR